MAKKKNSRKALAVVLGIMGVAGLSVASASNLDITSTRNVAAGSTPILAACDDAVNVTYTLDAAAKNYTAIVVSGISATCDTRTMQYALNDNATPTAAALASGSVTLDGSGTRTITFAAPMPIATTTFGSIDISIF